MQIHYINERVSVRSNPMNMRESVVWNTRKSNNNFISRGLRVYPDTDRSIIIPIRDFRSLIFHFTIQPLTSMSSSFLQLQKYRDAKSIGQTHQQDFSGQQI